MEPGPQTTPNTPRKLLEELEVILAEEALALRSPKGEELEPIAARKLEIERGLSQAGPLGLEDRAIAERVRAAALTNQMLLVHARDTVRGLIATMTGTPSMEHPLARQSTAPVRLDVKV